MIFLFHLSPFPPQILSVEEGDAVNLKITINLKKEEKSAGSLTLTLGNFHILLLHRVLRLIQMYLSPLDLSKAWRRFVPIIHWVLGPSLRVFQSKDKHIDVKITHPAGARDERESPTVQCLLGQGEPGEHGDTRGAVENLMLEMTQGQVTWAVMNVNQCIDQHGLIVEELGCKVNIKRNRGKRTTDAVISVDNIVVNLTPKDIQLCLHILQNNLLKSRQDLCELLPAYSCCQPEEQEPLVSQDSKWSAHLMIDQVTK